jgi:hypothetical protein
VAGENLAPVSLTLYACDRWGWRSTSRKRLEVTGIVRAALDEGLNPIRGELVLIV